jgi:hypothetical protein
MTDHNRALFLAAAALDWALTDDEQKELREHLRTCASCRRVAAGLGTDSARLHQLPRHDPPDRVRAAVQAAASSQARPRGPRLSLLLVAGLIGAGLIGGALGIGALTNRPSPRPTNLTGLPSSSTTPQSSPTKAPSPNATPNPALAAAPSAGAIGPQTGKVWERVSAPNILGSVTAVRSINAASFGIVAVGFSGGRAVAWRSDDGRSWIAATGVGGAAGADMKDVSSNSRGAIAVGTLAAGGSVVWTSTDGQRWARQQPEAFKRANVTLVAASELGIIAAGDTLEPGQRAGRGRIWFSADGTSWQVVHDVNHVQDVGAAHGRFVVVGCDTSGSAGKCTQSRAWSSPDGRLWTAASFPKTKATFSRLLSTSTGFTAGGAFVDLPDAPRIMWSSADGTSWQELPDAPKLNGEPNRFIAGIGIGLIGLRTSPNGSGTLEVYTSQDGTSWVYADSPTTIQEFGQVIVLPSGALLLTARDAQGWGFWLSPPEG